MTLEVADVAVVMCGEVAYAMVDLGRGVDDGIGMMSEASQGTAVLLRLELFCVSTCFGVVYLECVVGSCEKQQFSGCVKVERGAMNAGVFEELMRELEIRHCRNGYGNRGLQERMVEEVQRHEADAGELC